MEKVNENEQRQIEEAFKVKEKVVGDKLKKSLAKRRREIPVIISILESQKDVLEFHKSFAEMNLPLHSIIQNLSVFCPELGAKYMLKPCNDVNNYALKKIIGRHAPVTMRLRSFFRFPFCKKNVEPFTTAHDTLRKQYYRLAELSAKKDKTEIIHSFTEIVDNLQRIVPEKCSMLTDAVAAYNDAALAFYRVTEENYKHIKFK